MNWALSLSLEDDDVGACSSRIPLVSDRYAWLPRDEWSYALSLNHFEVGSSLRFVLRLHPHPECHIPCRELYVGPIEWGCSANMDALSSGRRVRRSSIYLPDPPLLAPRETQVKRTLHMVDGRGRLTFYYDSCTYFDPAGKQRGQLMVVQAYLELDDPLTFSRFRASAERLRLQCLVRIDRMTLLLGRAQHIATQLDESRIYKWQAGAEEKEEKEKTMAAICDCDGFSAPCGALPIPFPGGTFGVKFINGGHQLFETSVRYAPPPRRRRSTTWMLRGKKQSIETHVMTLDLVEQHASLTLVFKGHLLVSLQLFVRHYQTTLTHSSSSNERTPPITV